MNTNNQNKETKTENGEEVLYAFDPEDLHLTEDSSYTTDMIQHAVNTNSLYRRDLQTSIPFISSDYEYVLEGIVMKEYTPQFEVETDTDDNRKVLADEGVFFACICGEPIKHLTIIRHTASRDHFAVGSACKKRFKIVKSADDLRCIRDACNSLYDPESRENAQQVGFCSQNCLFTKIIEDRNFTPHILSKLSTKLVTGISENMMKTLGREPRFWSRQLSPPRFQSYSTWKA